MEMFCFSYGCLERVWRCSVFVSLFLLVFVCFENSDICFKILHINSVSSHEQSLPPLTNNESSEVCGIINPPPGALQTCFFY